jgi:hypothetical protein
MIGWPALRSQVDDQSFLLADKVRQPGEDFIGSTQLFMKFMRCHAWQKPQDGVSSKKGASEEHDRRGRAIGDRPIRNSPHRSWV